MSRPPLKNSTTTLPDPRDLATAADVLSRLSNPQRLEILCHLATEGELTAGEIVRRIQLSPSATSQHLARLRQVGLLETRREAQTIHYRIGSEDVGEILDLLHRLYCRRGK